MHFYRSIRYDGDEFALWSPTLGEAHASAKTMAGAERRIELFDIPTHKEGICGLLNGFDEALMALKPLRTWAITPRGGLKEVPNGE